MTRALAIDLGPKVITVNSVSPGFIDAPMARRAIDGDLLPVPSRHILASYPIPRPGRPEEIAAACAFLVSDEVGYITAGARGEPRRGGLSMAALAKLVRRRRPAKLPTSLIPIKCLGAAA